MKKLRWQIVIVVLALIAIAVLLIGQQPLLVSVLPAPVEGGLYIEGLVGSLGRLNPLLDQYNQPDQDIDRLVFSQLVQFDDRGLPHPDLAEVWGISVDGMVYNITLREDATWHDGKPVTAFDVAFTIDLLRDTAMPTPADVRELWDQVEVIAFDDRNLQFRLPQPFAPFIDYWNFGIVPQHVLEGIAPADMVNASFNLAPIGSGPYQFDQVLTENGQISAVVLSAYDGYYQERAFVDQIVFRYFDNAATAYTAYQEGEILGISQVSPDVLEQVLLNPNLNLYTSRLPQLSLVLLNLDNPAVGFFQETDIRRALLAALNRQNMINEVLDGQAMLADGPIFPDTWAYYPNLERINYDADAAIRQLKAAGFTIPAEGGRVRAREGVSLSFQLVYPNDPMHAALAQEIQSDWQRVGVGVELLALDYADLREDFLLTGRYEAALVDLDLSDSPDPDPYPFWHQSQITSGQNYSHWDDRRASEYLEQARVSLNIEDRIRLYRNFQVHFSREMPALPLFYPVYTYAVDQQVQGISIGPLFNPSDRFANIIGWFLRARVGEPSTPTTSP